jgi:hypothetical protein
VRQYPALLKPSQQIESALEPAGGLAAHAASIVVGRACAKTGTRKASITQVFGTALTLCEGLQVCWQPVQHPR